MRSMTMIRLLLLAALCALPALARAATVIDTTDGGIANGVYLYCKTGTNTVAPCAVANPVPIAGASNVGVPVPLTVQAAAYAASNAMGGLQTISVFRSTAQPSGVFNALTIASKGGSLVTLYAYVFDTNPTASTCTDKTAFALNSADVSKLAFAPLVITLTAQQGATATVGTNGGSFSIKNQDGTATTNLYVCVVTSAAVTPASTTDLNLKISVAQD